MLNTLSLLLLFALVRSTSGPNKSSFCYLHRIFFLSSTTSWHYLFIIPAMYNTTPPWTVSTPNFKSTHKIRFTSSWLDDKIILWSVLLSALDPPTRTNQHRVIIILSCCRCCSAVRGSWFRFLIWTSFDVYFSALCVYQQSYRLRTRLSQSVSQQVRLRFVSI